MDWPCKFCHQKSGFHWNHQGISSSMFYPNLEGKPVEHIYVFLSTTSRIHIYKQDLLAYHLTKK